MDKYPKGLTIEALKAKVADYLRHTTGGTVAKSTPDNTFVAAVVELDALMRIIGSTPNCNGIRIYLTKNDDGIWPVLVPVSRAGATGPHTDSLPQALLDSGDLEAFDCRSPPCAIANEGAMLLPDAQ